MGLSIFDWCVILATVVVVLVLTWVYLWRSSVPEVDYVVSSHDHHPYLVRNLHDKQQAADYLANIRRNLTRLVTYVKEHYPSDPRAKRLAERFDSEKTIFTEGAPDGFYTSYSLNKGEKIVFCLRQRTPTQPFVDLNTVMFVAIHELAHVMSLSTNHDDPEFWENMRFLLRVAMSEPLKIYQYQPYHHAPQAYCGKMITATPLTNPAEH